MDWGAALADPDRLQQDGVFLAEGRLVIEGLLASGRGDAIVSVLATPAAVQALALRDKLGDRLEVRSPREMEAVTGFNFHRGVLALVRRPATRTVEDLLAMVVSVPPLTYPDRRASATATPAPSATATPAPSATATPTPSATATPAPSATAPPALSATASSGGGATEGRRPNDEGRPDRDRDCRPPTADCRPDRDRDCRPPTADCRPDRDRDCRPPTADCRPVLVVLEHLVDVDNIGSCFRNARAFGAAGVLLDVRCADPLYRKAVRTSQGAVLELPWAAAPIDMILASLAGEGITSIGMTPRGIDGGRVPAALADVVAGLDPQRPVAVVVGNEGRGLSAATLAACTHLACIPMVAGADSINVATALAVALYQRNEGSGL